MSKRNDKLLLLDILDSVNKIFSYTKNLDFKSFSKDNKTVDAVVRNFEIIGEASKHLSKKLRNQFEIPWERIAGLRNVIVHEYFGVDNKIIWRIIKDQLHDFKNSIKNILAKVNNS